MSTETIPVEKTKRNYNVLFGLTLLALLVLLWIVLSFATPSFASANNIANLLRQGSMIAILAVGQTFVIITGGIDLSVGAVVGFCTVIRRNADQCRLCLSGSPWWRHFCAAWRSASSMASASSRWACRPSSLRWPRSPRCAASAC